MNEVLWSWTHLSSVVLLGSVSYMLSVKLPNFYRLVIATMIGAASFVPIGRADLAGFILAHLDMLSVSTVMGLLYLAFKSIGGSACQIVRKKNWSDFRSQILPYGLLVVTSGVCLYTSALGFVAFDVYAIGFGAPAIWVVLLMSLFFANRQRWLCAFCLLGSVVACRFQLADSPNLWNYLIDPWLFVCQSILMSAFGLRGSIDFCKTFFGTEPELSEPKILVYPISLGLEVSMANKEENPSDKRRAA